MYIYNIYILFLRFSPVVYGKKISAYKFECMCTATFE